MKKTFEDLDFGELAEDLRELKLDLQHARSTMSRLQQVFEHAEETLHKATMLVRVLEIDENLGNMKKEG